MYVHTYVCLPVLYSYNSPAYCSISAIWYAGRMLLNFNFPFNEYYSFTFTFMFKGVLSVLSAFIFYMWNYICITEDITANDPPPPIQNFVYICMYMPLFTRINFHSLPTAIISNIDNLAIFTIFLLVFF